MRQEKMGEEGVKVERTAAEGAGTAERRAERRSAAGAAPGAAGEPAAVAT